MEMGKVEVVKSLEKFEIIRLYSDAGLKENGDPYYQNVYISEDQVREYHPEVELIISGYGFIDKETGYQPENTPDWFYSTDEVEAFIEKNY
ncbi:hypothetical protein Bp8pS_001 [Bacillus phage vB_BpuM-BpSp]|nr:hypothetical protein Bp8pS_001 [Bacillus phage vB_BpuM-BpSp]